MTLHTVPARDVRVPEDARRAVEQHQPVTVVAHNRSRYVILHPDDYALVSPILERNRAGRPIPVEKLLTDEDYEILREDREDTLALGVLEAWTS